MVSVSERRRCRPGASATGPGSKSAFAGGCQTAVAGVVSPAVCRLRVDIGGGMPGEGRRRGGHGDHAAALAVAGGLAGAPTKATPASSSSDTARASGRVGADGRFSSRLVRGTTRLGGADGHDRRCHGHGNGTVLRERIVGIVVGLVSALRPTAWLAAWSVRGSARYLSARR